MQADSSKAAITSTAEQQHAPQTYFHITSLAANSSLQHAALHLHTLVRTVLPHKKVP
jgi:hypothetical protein